MLDFFKTGRRGWMLSRLMGLVLVGSGLSVVILAGLLFWGGLQTRLALQQAESGAVGQVERLESRITEIRGALGSESFAAAARSDSTDRQRLVSALREHNIANVLSIIVVANGAIEEADLSSLPGGGFAALDMLLQASSGRDVPAQVHFAGAADEYLAVVQAIDPASEGSPVALLTLPVSALSNRVELPTAVDSMRLVQVMNGEAVSLESYGERSSGPMERLAIDGSLLQLGWHKASRIGPLSIAQLAGFLLVGALTLTLGVLVVRRTRSPRKPAAAGASTPRSAAEPERPPEPVSEPDPHPVAAESSPAAYEETQSGDASDPAFDETLAPSAESLPEPSESEPAQEPADSEPEPMNDPVPAPEQPAEARTEKPDSESAADSVDATVAPPTPSASIFRAYDIRSVVGETLSAEVAEAIGRAVGSEARDRGLDRIAVARDGRLSGAELLAALTRGLTTAGLDVVDVGAVPTPVLYYAAQEVAGGSGVMVTGSHNPPDYNGFKIVLGGQTLFGERITELHQRLEQGRLVSGRGDVTTHAIASQYVERISSDIQLEKPIKVVADCGNGIAGAIAPRLLEAIGADVIPLYAEVDGTFPNHHPDPGDPATLEDLRLCVRNFDADVGVAFDGDGDRLGVVAPDGEIVYADRLMMLFARDVLSRRPDEPVIYDVKCSSLLAGEIESAGGKPVMTRTGHSYIKTELKEQNAPLAGEMSGHFFFGERWYGFDDGMYAAARLLEILAADTRASGQILGTLPKAFSTPELKVEMKEGEPHPFVEEFKHQAQFENAEINDIDGVRADFPDGFGLVRASNTTPVLVVRFEGNDKDALARIQKEFRDAMLAVNPALKLPF
jgi:phosphomannomutase